jgi:hypothetical protein
MTLQESWRMFVAFRQGTKSQFCSAVLRVEHHYTPKESYTGTIDLTSRSETFKRFRGFRLLWPRVELGWMHTGVEKAIWEAETSEACWFWP